MHIIGWTTLMGIVTLGVFYFKKRFVQKYLKFRYKNQTTIRNILEGMEYSSKAKTSPLVKIETSQKAFIRSALSEDHKMVLKLMK